LTKLVSVDAVQSRRRCGRGVTRRERADLQRWRHRRASTHVRTASSEGRKERMWWRASSGSVLMRSSPSLAMAAMPASLLAKTPAEDG
jgi:hypothetical protein